MSNLLMKDDGVENHCHLEILAKYNCKKNMAQDMCLLFNDRMKVKFIKGGTAKTLEGWWYTIYR